MATQTNTTIHPMPHMPSVHALGCALAAVNAEHIRIDTEKKDGGDALDLLQKREDALYDLIATLPAETLADAAVQIGVAATLVNILTACEWKDDPNRLGQMHDSVERLVLSALPLVAGAAGLDLTGQYWTDHIHFRTQRFSLAALAECVA